MANNKRIINVQNDINREPRFLAIGEGKVYKVDDNFKTVLKVMALNEGQPGPATLLSAIEMLLGKEAKKELMSGDYSFNYVSELFATAVAIATNTYEEEPKEGPRFQEQ